MMDHRVYLIEPCTELRELLASSSDHPLLDPSVVIAPELDFKLYYEGYRTQWEEKAIATFCDDVLLDYGDDPHVRSVIHDLNTDSLFTAFSKWWRIRDVESLPIDPEWRP